MKTKHVIIFAAVILVLIGLFFVVPNLGSSKSGAAASGMPSGGGAPGGMPGGGMPGAGTTETVVYSVKSAAAAEQSLQQYMELNGNIAADNTVGVYPDVAGKLVRVYIKTGTYVQAGTLVAEVDPSKAGSVYSTNKVYSPISGTVTSVSLNVGETVSTSSKILSVGQTDKLSIVVQVPEKDVGLLRLNLKAEVRLIAFEGDVFEARITSLSPVLDSTSRTKEVSLKFTVPNSKIDAGMFAKVKLYADPRPTHVTVSETAIVTRFDKKYVYVMDGTDKVRKQEITTGITVNGMTEVLTGLNSTDRYVTKGMELLDDGSSVKDISQTSSAAASASSAASPSAGTAEAPAGSSVPAAAAPAAGTTQEVKK